MHPFAYHQPKTLDEAVALLARLQGPANVLAGGTDLVVEMREGVRKPDHVVDLKKIGGLNAWSFDGTDGLRCGALVSIRALEMSETVRCHYAGLAHAASLLGSMQIRNRATLGGNVCRASPSADTLPPLIADGATAHLLGPNGIRSVPLESFFTGPGRTVLEKAEILTAIDIPAPKAGTGKCYVKLGRREAMELATVGVAATLTLDGGRPTDVRIALGAVAPTPIRAKSAEASLLEGGVGPDAVERAALAAAGDCSPISDVRASADYRRQMVRVLTRRAILGAIEAVR